jgi:CheY-like chemotaxis protein
VQLLEESGLDPLQKSLADIITTCGSTLHETLTSVLAYAKINQFKRRQQESRNGRHPGSQWALSDKTALGSSGPDQGLQSLYIRTNVAMLCEELVGVSESGRSFQSSANEDVIVVCNISYEENWCYYTEPGALRRIAVNIVGNALKYTKSGSITISLTATEPLEEFHKVNEDGEDVRMLNLTVEDTGKGMSKSFLKDHLFVPFTQEDSTSSHGVGLGMSIVKNLVSLLGGKIQVQSKVGAGTKITIALPMRMCGPKEDRASLAPEMQPKIDALRSRKLSVVVFGFPDFVRRSLETYLREWFNCSLLEATDEAEPDIVLVDEGNEKTLEELKRTAKLYGKNGVLLSAVLVISKMAKRMDTVEGYKMWERIPRPMGPSNVGKGLYGCLSKLDELRKRGNDASTNNENNESSLNKQTEELSSESNAASSELPMWAFERLQLSNNRDTAPLGQELSTSTHPDDKEPPPRPSDPESCKPDSKQDSKLQILVVDDNALNLKLLSGFFQRKGYHGVQQAKHGAEAVDAVQNCTEGFDIVFMGAY